MATDAPITFPQRSSTVHPMADASLRPVKRPSVSFDDTSLDFKDSTINKCRRKIVISVVVVVIIGVVCGVAGLVVALTRGEAGCVGCYRYVFSCPPRTYVYFPEWSVCRLTLSSGNLTASVQISTVNSSDNVHVILQPGESYIRDMNQTFPTDNGKENKGVIVTLDQELYCMVEQRRNWDTSIFTDSTQIHLLADLQDHYAYYLAYYTYPFGRQTWLNVVY